MNRGSVTTAALASASDPAGQPVDDKALAKDLDLAIADAKDHARLLHYVVESMVGSGHVNGRIELQHWESDVLLFASLNSQLAAQKVEDLQNEMESSR